MQPSALFRFAFEIVDTIITYSIYFLVLMVYTHIYRLYLAFKHLTSSQSRFGVIQELDVLYLFFLV